MEAPPASSSATDADTQVLWAIKQYIDPRNPEETVARYQAAGEPFVGIHTAETPMSEIEQRARSSFVDGCTSSIAARMLPAHHDGLMRVAQALWPEAIRLTKAECLSRQTDVCLQSWLKATSETDPSKGRFDLCYSLFDADQDTTGGVTYLTPKPVVLASVAYEMYPIPTFTLWTLPPRLVDLGHPEETRELEGYSQSLIPISASRPGSDPVGDTELTKLLFP